MPPKQRMRIASQKHSQNVTSRGNVPKSQIVSETEYNIACQIYIVSMYRFLPETYSTLCEAVNFVQSEIVHGRRDQKQT